jgi:hypothetical protein
MDQRLPIFLGSGRRRPTIVDSLSFGGTFPFVTTNLGSSRLILSSAPPMVCPADVTHACRRTRRTMSARNEARPAQRVRLSIERPNKLLTGFAQMLDYRAVLLGIDFRVKNSSRGTIFAVPVTNFAVPVTRSVADET